MTSLQALNAHLNHTIRPYARPDTNGASIPVYKAKGMSHRRMSYAAALGLGVDLKLGFANASYFSTEQVRSLLPIPVSARDLEDATARRKHELQVATKNGNGHDRGNSHGNGHGNSETPMSAAVTEVTVEDVPVTTVTNNTEMEAVASVPDTPEARIAVRRLAASLDCEVVQPDNGLDPRVDLGPYVLVDAASGTWILQYGLPLAGVVAALRCLAHERRLPADRVGEAWTEFGSVWGR